MIETKTREQLLEDFATIFAHTWYRDFPLHKPSSLKAKRADWTIHIGVAVRSAADLMGLFTRFESGQRTDAVLRDRGKDTIAAIEWEWTRLSDKKTNELQKLREATHDSELFPGLRFASLISYSRDPHGDSDLQKVVEGWTGARADVPLLLVAIHFVLDHKRKQREFRRMTFHEILSGKAKFLREQPAYPWAVKNSRWELELKP